MDDGARSGSGMKLCTNCFTYKDQLRLVNVLFELYGLKCTIQSAGVPNQYIIYI